ncbi:hypothetical protein HQ36_05355 [Porphyromonas gingivicanis]|uniref:N-acetylmuramoyl-L-alanine amidase n=1 Tax=Porphyromonas gingivicanis TaxID=266762 RepID=A0A0A2G330_9PORP|nr:N-acetylmuramoyl-L-alanine amidase [Porphyromonas gingivicanis]KGN97703.1 hypothetical protein HQ36_05355 [Porphyromonas gingivicanis]
MRAIEKIIVHCSATPPEQDIGVAEIRSWHQERGWCDVGYHYVVRRDGSIEVGRAEELVGAHCRGYNRTSIGICYVGGVNSEGQPEDNRTPPQRVALRKLVESLMERYPRATLHGHRDFAPKACPSFDVLRSL